MAEDRASERLPWECSVRVVIDDGRGRHEMTAAGIDRSATGLALRVARYVEPGATIESIGGDDAFSGEVVDCRELAGMFRLSVRLN